MLIPVDVGAAQESKPVPNGVYDVQITECLDTKSQAGKPMLSVSLVFEAHPDAPSMRHFISLPVPGEEASKTQYKALMLKRFLTQFKQPIPNQIDTEKLAMSLVGAKAKAEVTLSEPDAETGNVYNRLTVPRLRDESAVTTAKPPKR